MIFCAFDDDSRLILEMLKQRDPLSRPRMQRKALVIRTAELRARIGAKISLVMVHLRQNRSYRRKKRITRST